MKTRESYKCAECGARSPRWQGQCPSCGLWNTLKPDTAGAWSGAGSGSGAAKAAVGGERPLLLEEVPPSRVETRASGFEQLDRVLGRGLAPGGALLLGGEPGIGKSTLLLQLTGRQAALGRKAVYVSGEESLEQIRRRAERLGLLGPGLSALASTRVEDVLAVLDRDEPELVVVDSVQTFVSPRADGIPGSVGQVRAVAGELVERIKRTGCTLVLVGHVTKEGQIAGPKLLEHTVDTVLYLEGDRRSDFRILRVLKNRFGPSDELLVFRMEERGLAIVEDPSTFFLDNREPGLSGTAVVLGMEGQRPFAVEVQALAARSFLNIPRRTALGFDTNRLHLLLAVLEKRLGLNLGQYDIYAKIGGGLALRDPGLDLGVAAAVLSSCHDRPLPENAVFWGEVDLNGRIRPAPGHEIRLKQAARLGYKPVFHPGNATTCRTLKEFQRTLFGAP